MAQLGSVTTDIDPRLGDPSFEKGSAELPATNGQHGGTVRPQHRRLHDSGVTFEEYHFYAQQTRAEEDTQPAHGRETNLLSLVFPSKSDGGIKQKNTEHGDPKRNLSNPDTRAVVSDEEWTNASRALRTATKGAIFYLITTDILGPFGLPYAFATMGWG
jgi:hypothetical protein